MKNLLTLLLTLLVSVILIPAGIVYHLITSVLSVIRLKFWQGIYKFFGYWVVFMFQLYYALSYICYHGAVAIDLLWNSVSGDLIERITVEKRSRGLGSYGRGNFRLTECLGSSENNRQLTRSGKFIIKIVDFIFLAVNYCQQAVNKMFYRKMR